MNNTMRTGLENGVVDPVVYKKTVELLGRAGVRLPQISELANPSMIDSSITDELGGVDPDKPDPRNLYRLHWQNAENRRDISDSPPYFVFPPELIDTPAKIVVVPGNRFPLIQAHKVLAAYGCLMPRLITGQFDPSRHRAVWPSTGNYCRGGVAISNILGCRSVALLPEGMSKERFRWLENWVADPKDVIRTPGTESNVKEIYDACRELSRDSRNIVLNQFAEFGNYIVHRAVTGPALERVAQAFSVDGSVKARAFVSATGSAGTLAAGDYLKEKLGTRIVAVEALECPTMLYNGYGEHNIQGIGDKHIPLIHNVMNTDFVAGVSFQATDALNLLFNSTPGQDYLRVHKGLSTAQLRSLADLGLSSIANVIAAIKVAKYSQLGPEDAVLTVATDGAGMYRTEMTKTESETFRNDFGVLDAAEVLGRYLLGTTTDHLLEMSRIDRERVFNLGYYTWVEQQDISVEDFDARRSLDYWEELMGNVDAWDLAIEEFNGALHEVDK